MMATRFGVTRAIPKPNVIIAVKIGLRTNPNTPVRTSVVVSPGSQRCRAPRSENREEHQ